jgi:hypothetical protein
MMTVYNGEICTEIGRDGGEGSEEGRDGLLLWIKI